MHKKLQTLVMSGIIVSNTACSTCQVFANKIGIEKDTKIEKISSEEDEIVVPENSQWATFKTEKDLEGKWSYEVTTDGKIKLKQYLDGTNNPIVEIPRIIDDKEVELESLNGGTFKHVTHLRVAKGDGYKVKLLANDLSLWAGFHQTDTLKYADFSGLDASNVTNLYQAFSFSSSIEYVDLSGWDVSNVTNMRAIFYKSPNLKSINLSGWNIKEGVDTGLIIHLSTKLNNIILKDMPSAKILKDLLFGMRHASNDSITLDVSNLNILEQETSLNNMFINGKMSKIIGLDTWNTSNITDMGNMFNGCSSLTSIEGIKNWNTDKLQNMENMLERCSSLTDVSAIEKWNTSNVTKMNGTFNGCSNIESLNLGSWNTSSVTNFNGMFKNCSSLTAINGIERLNTSNVTTMLEIFMDCNKLKSLNLSNWDTSRVTNIQSMFLRCRDLSNLNVSGWNTNSVTNMNWLFEDCNSLTQIEGINTWNTSNTVSMQGVFQRCNKLNNLDLSNWNTARVNAIPYMFKGCTSLSNLNISNWNVSNICSMAETFMNTPSLNLINLSNWSLRSDVNTCNMFKIEGDTPAKILIITNDEKLKSYAYSGVNRVPAKVTVEANNGQFDEGNQKIKERFTITKNEYDNINNTIKEDINSFGQPTREGYTFAGWIITKKPTSKFDMLDMTYKAVWKNTNGEGSIEIPLLNGGQIIIKPNQEGQLPSYDDKGNITLPQGGGVVTLPGNIQVTVPGESIIKPDGSVIVSNGGEVTLPNNGQAVTVKPGTVINPDGTIKNPPTEDNNGNTETKPEVKPSIFDKIDKEVVDIVGNGDGQENNPIILVVKDVDKTKLNTFLDNLKELNPKVTSISKGYADIEYKLEVDNKNSPLKENTYVTIKVDNNKIDLAKVLNKFSRGTNEKIEIPILASFIDVTGHWAKTNIEEFASMGLINGYEDGTFKPDASITRAEFVKIVNSVFGYTQPGVVTFTDVNKGDWFYNEVAIAKQAGYINGKSEFSFAPNDKITREEVAKILTTIMKNKDDVLDRLHKFPDGNQTSDWAKPYVEGAIEAGYLSGDNNGYLNPTKNITRAEAVTVLSRLK